MAVDVRVPYADTLGVILGGKLAPRLGPLALAKNESLVIAGQQPLLITQIRALMTAGIRRVVVFTRFEWVRQLRELTGRALGGLQTLSIDIVEDDDPTTGPASALGRVLSAYAPRRGAVVLYAGSFLPPRSLTEAAADDWVGVGPAPASRNWCTWSGEHYIDGFAPRGSEVAVGAFRFTDTRLLCKLSARTDEAGEGGMASLLNRYDAERMLMRVALPEWRDFSDLDVIAMTGTGLVRTRPHNTITRASTTMIQKRSGHSDFRAEVRFLRKLDARRARLFPRYEITGRDSYRLDYVDLPTLAQLYLYWPAQPGHWSGILRTITNVMKDEFWPARPRWHKDRLARGAEDMYIRKTRQRLQDWGDPLAGEQALRVNDAQYIAGERLLHYLTPQLHRLARNPIPAFLHGDLNFANILYSLTARTFQLLDPRGAWSGYGPMGDLRYDLAKLRYSYCGMFNAICDGLYTLGVDGNRVTFDLGIERSLEISACDHVIGEFADLQELRLIEIMLLLSAPPLHGGPNEDEPRALYIRGVELANQLLEDQAG